MHKKEQPRLPTGSKCLPGFVQLLTSAMGGQPKQQIIKSDQTQQSHLLHYHHDQKLEKKLNLQKQR